jgi:hypothetical protein
MAAMRTFPTLTFCHVADAAFVCSCGITLLTTQWIPPERPLRGSSWAFTNHPVAAPGPTVRSRNRTGVPSFTFGPRGITHQTRQWLFCNGANFEFPLLLNTMLGKTVHYSAICRSPCCFSSIMVCNCRQKRNCSTSRVRIHCGTHSVLLISQSYSQHRSGNFPILH